MQKKKKKKSLLEMEVKSPGKPLKKKSNVNSLPGGSRIHRRGYRSPGNR